MWTQSSVFYLAIVATVSYLSASSAATDVQIRLVNPLESESTRCSGRVEIYHNNSWGMVCDYGWGINDAEVVCSQLDCGPAVNATQQLFFGQETGQIWLTDVSCSGTESSLTECKHRGFGTHSCGHYWDAGVICSGVPIRLAGSGSTQCSGRVEYYYKKRWGTVCDNGWDINDAEVVCRQLDCGPALKATRSAQFGEGTGDILLDNVACSGSESSLTECQHRGFGTHNCGHHQDAGVICSGIRLAGSQSPSSGRVEIYHKNSWGTVCDDGWDINDAQVVCRQLVYGTALAAPKEAHFGEGSGPIWFDDVACLGNERSITQCQLGDLRSSCRHHKDAGVICSGVAIRLAGSGSTQCSGRVEIAYNKTWGTVCDHNWDINDAEVVCRELNCGTALNATRSAHFGEGTGEIWLDDVSCSGSERSLTECQHREFGRHSCTHSKDAGVICSGVPVRLSGSTLCSGRVEIFYNNTWGTVCHDNWDINDAEVVCRELGCGTAQSAAASARFGEGSGSIWLDDVSCSGSERSLTECQHRGFGTHDCTHSKDAGVVCSVIFPKPRIFMNPANKVKWRSDLNITCSISPQSQQHLQGEFTLKQISGSFSQTKPSTTNSATFKILNVDFDKDGLYQCEYSHDSSISTSDSANLSVIVSLEWPRISVMSPNGGVVKVPEGAEIIKGYSFNFTCTTSVHYPGAVFFLIFSRSNMKYNMTSVNNSAYLSFPVADFEHDADYSCVYEITLPSRKITAQEARWIRAFVIYSRTPFLRYVFLPLILLLENIALHFYYKVSKKQKPAKKENAETDVSRAEEVHAEEEAAEEIE
uniref:Deleted in malignant brain tumors 1 protein-like n=2 Tax=Oreochromis aureus TaxID=47969 RepID=A0AAZ1XU82_OREAU